MVIEGSTKVDRSHKGLVQVYTGPGKGKTTAAVGLALRAAGHGLRGIMIKFLERDFPYGENAFVSSFHPFEIVSLNHGRNQSLLSLEERRDAAQRSLSYAEGVLIRGNYNVVILDDIFNEVDLGVLNVGDIMHLIILKPEWVELILTGSVAPPEVQKRADVVTQMLMIKHPFYDGIGPRKGIDY